MRAFLVDLPGYGFAEAPVAKVAQWQALLKTYLAGRATLARAFVLIDSRHGVKAVDHEIMALLDTAAVSFQAVLTKTDKPKKGQLETVLERLHADLGRHPAAFPEVLTTSSETGDGLANLRATITRLLS